MTDLLRSSCMPLTLAAAAIVATQLVGCGVGRLAGAIGAAEEAQKLLEVYPKYEGLENKTLAVVVQADYSTMFEHPDLVVAITSGVTVRIARWVPGAQVLDPQRVLQWQYRTPQWNALPYGKIAEELNVDRVVFVDMLEYRLHPPGNRYLWEGVAIGRVGIVERDGLDPDTFADTFDITSNFPTVEGVDYASANQAQIKTGLMSDFVKRVAWLFHYHYEPKHPDKYRPDLDTKQMRELKQKTGS